MKHLSTEMCFAVTRVHRQHLPAVEYWSLFFRRFLDWTSHLLCPGWDPAHLLHRCHCVALQRKGELLDKRLQGYRPWTWGKDQQSSDLVYWPTCLLDNSFDSWVFTADTNSLLSSSRYLHCLYIQFFLHV